jgi:hypothetical protein
MPWKINTASWPHEQQASLKLNETLWPIMADLMKKGLAKDYGIYPDGISGFILGRAFEMHLFYD